MEENPLQRRDFFRLAAGAMVAGVEVGCAPPASVTRPRTADLAAQLDPSAADAMLAKIDQRLAWIDRASLPDDVLPLSRMQRGPRFDEQLASESALVRKSIRTLYVTGRFLDMPDEMKVHPGMQDRLKAMQPEMDVAVLDMTERLERMTLEDHRRLQAYLQKDPLFGERLAGVLEQPAKDDGLSFQRTFGIRSSILDISRRMSAQSPSLVTDPLVSKVRRIEAHPRTDAEQSRRMAARIGENTFWAHQERLAMLHDAWALRLGTTSAIASTGDFAPSPASSSPASSSAVSTIDPNAAPPPARPHRGVTTMKVGGIIMGFGAASVVAGLIMAGINGGFSLSTGLGAAAVFFGITVGPILLAVGLIVLLVGLAIYAAT